VSAKGRKVGGGEIFWEKIQYHPFPVLS